MLDFNRSRRASIPDRQPVRLRNSFLADVQMRKQSDPALNPLRGGKPPLSGRQRILWMRERHRERLGDDEGASPQSRSPMPLLTVVALQGDRVIQRAKSWVPRPFMCTALRRSSGHIFT